MTPTNLDPTSNGGPFFHLLISAAAPNARVCKTLLSASILNYPPPTLINFNRSSSSLGQDAGSDAGITGGILAYLAKTSSLKADDIALIVHGDEVWFQLPPELLLHRYHRIIEQANRRLLREFGSVRQQKPWQRPDGRKSARFVQKVVFATYEGCRSNSPGHRPCASVPSSTLPDGEGTAGSDASLGGGGLIPPMYLNAESVIGRVADVKAIYEHAVLKMQEEKLGNVSVQHLFSQIYGEQEHARNLFRASTGYHRWPWLSEKTRFMANHTQPTATTKDGPVPPRRRFDYGIGLDEEKELFQATARSMVDIDFLRLNESDRWSPHFPPRRLASLLHELSSLPCPVLARAQRAAPETGPAAPLNPPPAPLQWSNIPLAMHTRRFTIPILLQHEHPDVSEDSKPDPHRPHDWWPRMWYQADARALLRDRIQASLGFRLWDRRGGAGGFWTDRGRWLKWREICAGFEDDLFRDGRGPWGREQRGAGVEYKRVNGKGQMMEDGELGP